MVATDHSSLPGCTWKPGGGRQVSTHEACKQEERWLAPTLGAGGQGPGCLGVRYGSHLLRGSAGSLKLPGAGPSTSCGLLAHGGGRSPGLAKIQEVVPSAGPSHQRYSMGLELFLGVNRAWGAWSWLLRPSGFRWLQE